MTNKDVLSTNRFYNITCQVLFDFSSNLILVHEHYIGDGVTSFKKKVTIRGKALMNKRNCYRKWKIGTYIHSEHQNPR